MSSLAGHERTSTEFVKTRSGQAGQATNRGPTVRRKLTLIVVTCVGLAFAAMASVQVHSQWKSLYDLALKNSRTITRMLGVQITGGVRWRKAEAIERAYSAFTSDPDSLLASLMTLDIDGNVLTSYQSTDLVPYDFATAMELAREALEKTQTFRVQTARHFVVITPVVAGKDQANIGTLAVAWSLERLHDQVTAALIRQLGLAAAALAFLMVTMILLLNRIVIQPLKAMTDGMTRLAGGDTGVEILAAGRDDEIGAMARAVQVFKENAIELWNAQCELEGKSQDLAAHRDRLEKALEKQQEFNSLQREFVSMASHEFRTPLAIIDASAQRIQRRIDQLTPEELGQRIEKIRGAVKRMTGLIESTLSASRLEAGAIEMKLEPCDVFAIVSKVCGRQQEIATSHRITFIADDSPQEIFADPKLLDQVFTNLLSNAVKYSPNNPDIEVRGLRQGEQVIFSVRDHGLGISAGELPKLFQRYFRAKTSTGIAGTGIGLNLVKQLLEMHRGSIEVESIVGRGSTFTVRLPMDPRNEAPGHPTAIKDVT